MSLALAVPFAVLSGIAYGASTAVQHSAAAASGGGTADGRGLLRLLRDPRWLLSIAGDSVGLLAQILALATGPVVLVAPLLVIAVPVALPVGYWLGGPRPRPRDLAAAVAVVAGLGLFLVLVGDPGEGSPPDLRAVLLTLLVALGAGGLLVAAVWTRPATLRAGGLAAVSGVWFGLAGVLMNAAAIQVRHHGWSALFTQGTGLASLIALLVLGGLGLALVQIAFQLGSLAASFPANEAAAPVAAVVMGAVVLHQHVPLDPGRWIGYLAGLAVVVVGITALAVAAENADGAAAGPGDDATMGSSDSTAKGGE